MQRAYLSSLQRCATQSIRRSSLRRVLIFSAALLLIAGKPAVQDADFDARIENPAYSEEGPRVCVDEAHRNHHTAGGRYAPLARLLENDGYRVVGLRAICRQPSAT